MEAAQPSPASPRIVATIQVDDELATEARLANLRWLTFIGENLFFHGIRFGLLVLVAFLLGQHWDGTLLIVGIAGSAAALTLFFTGVRCKQVHDQIAHARNGHAYRAIVDDAGVSIESDPQITFHRWDEYTACTDRGDALQLWHRNDTVSFVPINPDTASLVEFVKTKVPERHAGRDAR